MIITIKIRGITGKNENYEGETYYDDEKYYDQEGELQASIQGEHLIKDSNQGYGSVDQTSVGDNDNFQGYVCMVREISPAHSTTFQSTKSLDYNYSTVQCERVCSYGHD